MLCACLHDRQYAFPGGGTLKATEPAEATEAAGSGVAKNPGKQSAALQRATYACFFDAANAYDSVPHTLPLHRGYTSLQSELHANAYLSFCTRNTRVSSLTEVWRR